MLNISVSDKETIHHNSQDKKKIIILRSTGVARGCHGNTVISMFHVMKSHFNLSGCRCLSVSSFGIAFAFKITDYNTFKESALTFRAIMAVRLLD